LVQNRIIEVEEDFSHVRNWNHLSDYMNGLLAGLTFHQVREKDRATDGVEKNTYDQPAGTGPQAGGKAPSRPRRKRMSLLKGEHKYSERIGIRKHLPDEEQSFFEPSKKRLRWSGFSTNAWSPRESRISIGTENTIREIETCSLRHLHLQLQRRGSGALGVIGPRRNELFEESFR